MRALCIPDKPLRFVSVLVKDPKDSAKPGACTCWAPTLPPPTPPPVIRSQGFPTVYAAPTAGLISLPHNWSRRKTRPGSNFFLAGLRIRNDTRLATFFFLRLNDTLHATPSHTHTHTHLHAQTHRHTSRHTPRTRTRSFRLVTRFWVGFIAAMSLRSKLKLTP